MNTTSEKNKPQKMEKPLLRDAVGVFSALIIIVAFVLSGFVEYYTPIFIKEVDANIPGDWKAAMLSMASMALGYLFGKDTPDVIKGKKPTIAGSTEV